MNEIVYSVKIWIQSMMYEGWAVIDSLNRTEWLVLLSAIMVIGFCLMRGFGSRSRY